MAVTTGIYYCNLDSVSATKRRLYFVPGDHRDITTDDLTTYTVEMPHDFIISAKIKRGFEKDMPVGQELASVLELEINYNSSMFNTTAYNALKTPLFAQESETGVTVWLNADREAVDAPLYNEAVVKKIPNRWYVAESTDNWTSHTIIWDGLQERVKQYEFDGGGTYTINVFDIVTTIMRNIPIAQIGWNLHETYNATAANLAQELLYYYTDYQSKRYHISNSNEDWTGDNKLSYLHVSFISNFMVQCNAYMNTLLGIYRRQNTSPSAPILSFKNNPLTNWKFYKQNYTDQTVTGTLTEITDKTTIKIINSVFVDGTPNVIVGGCASDTSSEGSWGKELKNLSNLFKALAENFLYKAYFNYNVGYVNYLIMPIFDHSASDGTTLSAAIDINTSNIVNDWKLTYGTEFEQSICHINNVNEEDIAEISKENPEFSRDEGAVEIKNILHNCFCAMRLKTDVFSHLTEWVDDNNRRLPTKHAITQCLFYYDASMNSGGTTQIGKVAEYCRVLIGGSEYILSEVYSNTQNMYGELGEIGDVAVKMYSNVALPRQAVTGIPYVVAKAANEIFNAKHQGLFEFRTKIDTINITDLGRTLHIDFYGLTNATTKLSTNDPNAVITNLEWDLSEKFISVKAFIRGDT